MKVLFLFWGAGEGGDASALIALASELKSRHAHITIAAYAYAHPEIFKAKAEAVGFVFNRDLFLIKDAGNVWEEIKLSRSYYDVLHVHHGRTVPKRTDIQPIRRAAGDLPLIFTAHGPLPLKDITYGGLTSKISRFLSPVWFDAIVVPSEAKAREWREMTPFSGKVRPIHNIVGFLRKWDKRHARKELNLPEDAEIALYCSRLDEDKDPFTFIKAAALAARENPNLLGIMAGDGSLAEACDQLIKEKGAPVQRLGYLQDVSRVYSASDVFVQTSLYESFGITLLQAAANELPCVASDIGVFRDFYGGFDSFGWFNPGDFEACSINILKVLKEPPNTQKQAQLKQTFGPDSVIEAHQKLWQELVNKKCTVTVR
ncbi:MAG TPA: glycosyltransferase family 4 protein [Fimbriimonadaceae bacterium]|jgi:glycosyltransferase involved in cell wall biosynthesis